MGNKIKIEKRLIGEEYDPFIIAEIGINHEGDFNKAKQMIKDASESGAECVKFQMHVIEDEMIREADNIIPANANESIWKIIERCTLSKEEHIKLKRYTEDLGMIYLCTPFSRAAADILEHMSISAYKIYDLIRLFINNGHEVKVIVTENAKHFVEPLVMDTLSKNACMSDMFSRRTDVVHIELASWADIFVLAPATANIIGKISHGIADDLLSTAIISMDKVPCIIFPAMNSVMYASKVVEDNIKRLKSFGYFIAEPARGSLARGETGKGRLPDPEAIFTLTRA